MVGSLPLKQQYERAIHGTNPQTGKPGKPADASKFFNSTDIDNVIIQAERQYHNNPTAYPNGNVNITLSRPIGEGYIGNTKANIKNGYTVGEYRWSNIATVGIDVKTGKAYTAYPNLKLGYRK